MATALSSDKRELFPHQTLIVILRGIAAVDGVLTYIFIPVWTFSGGSRYAYGLLVLIPFTISAVLGLGIIVRVLRKNRKAYTPDDRLMAMIRDREFLWTLLSHELVAILDLLLAIVFTVSLVALFKAIGRYSRSSSVIVLGSYASFPFVSSILIHVYFFLTFLYARRNSNRIHLCDRCGELMVAPSAKAAQSQAETTDHPRQTEGFTPRVSFAEDRYEYYRDDLSEDSSVPQLSETVPSGMTTKTHSFAGGKAEEDGP